MPDIHWQVGEGVEQETIAKTAPRRRSRRRWMAILIVVVLGAGLGAIYRSIPEPAPRPTPALSPTPHATPTLPAVLAKLYAAIDREAQALADGDGDSYWALQMPRDEAHRDQPRDDLTAWGRPADNSSLYTVIDYNLHTSTQAWADIRQFRNGRWFRQTRFYQFKLDEGRWLRSEPDPSFWNGERETQETQHFNLHYAVEDRELVSPIARRLEELYQSMCRDLGCAPDSGAEKIEVTLLGNDGPMIDLQAYFVPAGKEKFEMRFPSPRVTGVFEIGRPTHPNFLEAHLEALLLASYLVNRVSQRDKSRDVSRDVILTAIQIWAAARSDPQIDYFSSRVSAWGQKPVLTLEQLWGSPRDELPLQRFDQAELLIYFIEQEYGVSAVADLLKALGPAQSLSEAVDKGLGVPFAEFEQKWQAWVKQNISSQ